MSRTVCGSPVLSSLMILLLMSCPVVSGIRSERSEDSGNILYHPVCRVLFPGTLLIYIVILIIFFSVRHIEHMIGSCRVLVILAMSWAFDLAGLYLLLHFGIKDGAARGPYALVTALLCIYSVLFPSVRSRIFEVNEKFVLFLGLGMICAFDGIWSITSVVMGFLVFCLSAPLFLPTE